MLHAALLLCLAPLLPAQPDAKVSSEPVPIFNGRDLTGWKQFAGKPGVWKVEDGMVVCQGDGGGWLGTEKEYADFELELEYKLRAGGNSGVYIRAPESGHISRVGMEIQLLDDLDPQYKKVHYYQNTGAIYHVVAPRMRAAKPGGQWNAIKIRAEGRRVKVWVNGEKVVDADLDTWREDPAIAREHPGLGREGGHIGLQSHTDRVEFRDIRLRDLAE